MSLQKNLQTRYRDLLAIHAEIMHLEDELADFSDTAAVTTLMDIVILVDTAVAHLAGAPGKTIWLMLPFTAE